MATRPRPPKPKRLILDVRHRRLNGQGFGCYFTGSARRGAAKIYIDCDAIAWVAATHREHCFKRQFIEAMGHEFMHAIEDLFGVMFNERAIERAILTQRKARR